MEKIISHDSTPPSGKTTADKVRWSGRITAFQSRAWVWRYKSNYRTHHVTGFNIWVKDKGKTVIVAISGLQQQKLGFLVGDTAAGTGWPVQGGKREIADFYRAGDLKVLDRSDRPAERSGPPFIGTMPDLETYKTRGCQMLDATVWRTVCMPCMWANKSRIEIEVCFGKSKRYRSETFCYGPKSCPNYSMGEPRDVPYRDSWYPEIRHTEDDGGMDSTLTGHRGEDD